MTLRYDTEHRLANPNEKPTETQKKKNKNTKHKNTVLPRQLQGSAIAWCHTQVPQTLRYDATLTVA